MNVGARKREWGGGEGTLELKLLCITGGMSACDVTEYRTSEQGEGGTPFRSTLIFSRLLSPPLIASSTTHKAGEDQKRKGTQKLCFVRDEDVVAQTRVV